MSLVFNVLEQPGQTKLEGQLVIVELVASLTDEFAPGFVPTEDLAVFSRAIIKTDTVGRWELDLRPTFAGDNVYSVTGLVYKVTESAAGGESAYYIDVRAAEIVDGDEVPQWVGDILTIAPDNLPTQGDFTAADIPLDTSDFDNNLNSTIDDVQAFADFFDDMDLSTGDGSGGHVIKQAAETFTQRPTLRIAEGFLTVSDDNINEETILDIDLGPDLGPIDLLTTSPYGRSVLEQTDAPSAATYLNVVSNDDIGVTVASLVDGLIPVGQLPALAINDVFTVGSQAAMLALDADVGDVAIRTDTEQSFILADLPATLLGNWVELSFGGDVASVNGQSGVVILTASDVGAVDTATFVAHVNDTTDAHDGSAISLDASGFVGNLDITVDTVQELAAIVDGLEIGTGSPTGAAGGELAGTYPNPTVTTVHSGSSHADVQAAAEGTAAGALSTHIADTSNAHVAQAVSVDASGFAGGILAGTTTVQTFAATVNSLQASQVPVDTTDFVGNLTAAESNVQAAFAKLDALVVDSPVVSVNGGVGAVVLDAADVGAIDVALFGAPSGVATLDVDGRLTLAEWPDGLVTSVNGYNGSEVTLVAADIAIDDGTFSGNAVGVLDVQALAATVDALTTGSAIASAVTFTPAGTVAATNVQAAIEEVAAEASSATIDASGFAQNLTTADNTLAEIAARYNTPDRFAVDYDVHITADPTEFRQGTGILVRLDLDLDYDNGTSGGFANGPNYSLDYQAAAWDGWKSDGVADPARKFPTGVLTLTGTNTFSWSAGLVAGGVGFMEYRVSKNPAGVDRDITNYNSFINNHVFLADGADISWFAGRGSYIVGLTNYGAIGFSSQPVFAVHNVNGGTMDAASNTDFYSGPVVMPGVTMANRWGLYIDDANDSYASVDAIELGGVIERAVGIQINELVTADDYNIPINYGDPNVANAPLFRVEEDGQVVTGGVKGLNNLLALKPGNTTSNGIFLVDAANTQIAPISGYTLTTAAARVLQVQGTYTMSATTGTLANSFTGVYVAPTVDYTENGNAFGSSAATFSGIFKASQDQALGPITSLFLSPEVNATTATVTTTAVKGVYFQPNLSRTTSGSLTVTDLVGFHAAGPAIAAGVTVVSRSAIQIDDATNSGTFGVQYGLKIAAMTAATTNIGIENASTTLLKGGLYGSDASGGDLDVHATTHATTGTIFLHDEVEQRPTDQTFTTTPNWLLWNNAYTMNMATAAIGSFVNIAPTVLMQQSGSALGSVQAISVAPTVKTLTTGTADLGLIIGVQSVPGITADTITGRSASVIAYNARPVFTQANSGTITSGTTINYSSGLTLNTGNTQSAFTHLAVNDATGSGTLTLQVGVDIPALTKATTNYGLRSLAAINILAALYGSTSSGGHLPLRTTPDSTKGDIQLDNPTIELLVTNYTNTAATYKPVFVDATLTMNAGSGGSGSNQLDIFHINPTVVFDQQGSVFGHTGITVSGTWKNTATEVNTIGPVTSFFAQPTINADDATGITATITGFSSSWAMSETGNGGLTVTTATGFLAGGAVPAANTAITTRYGFYVSNVASSLITTQVGLHIEALSTAGTNIGIRNLSATHLGSSGQTVIGTAGTFTTFAGFADGVNIVVGGSSGTKIATSATAQKLGFFNATPVVQPVSANQAAVGTTAPAGGTGAAAGGWSSAGNRDTAITTINSCVTLVNQLRADLVTLGIIKGSA